MFSVAEFRLTDCQKLTSLNEIAEIKKPDFSAILQRQVLPFTPSFTQN